MIEPSFTVDGQVVDAELFDAADPGSVREVAAKALAKSTAPKDRPWMALTPIEREVARCRITLIVGALEDAGYAIVKRRTP